jgi:hypothetical protein
MKLLLGKIGNQIALMLTLAWFARDPDWEQGILAVTFFFAWLGMEVFPGRGLTEHDCKLFKAFTEVLPSDGPSLVFLKEHDLGGEFQSSCLDQIDEFLRTWQNAEHEFNNKKLEKQRKALIEVATKFRRELGNKVASAGNGYLSLGLQDLETRPHVLRSQDELNKLATEVYKAHQELIRLGRGLHGHG